ncbi:hypothetical protein H112_06158 [Trichophyton rubrum D6]|uniref:Uncharacterized protein n=4 Tax=Trichophyton TaxID=5550 RepID=F2SMC7_TRIRC|nr:uncharacterized protein TERG_03848 [Trichophyton rubrum CBS 118892]EZF14349.1 hypothetical protein H100_06172 [Trichophyton rubrum MR850]EZF39840.1 hypothetical protein H102_06141 [Trichophyton rubrum CBS 100081]EZF50468.1 hypothetical protein H103_06165 [Trichophyton rubrum CBS 288.86]EZF61061.1 hypothetical protein H104_06153 [Trichophyton rubrum CBS 289.86]EZF71618.1 hypothetical protein H105_06178 [Trichophyton soudanense CBS 452.61]EZF82531.1 hypothetical protein H110_06161 [Trichophy
MEGVGRKKHLTALFSIFEPYATCWEDFGGFLKVLFGETTPPSLAPSGRGEPAVRVEPLETRQCLCRHNEGGQHHSYLYTDERAEARGGELDIAVFNHTRYSRPCITTGAQEEKKNPDRGTWGIMRKLDVNRLADDTEAQYKNEGRNTGIPSQLRRCARAAGRAVPSSTRR